MSGSAASLLSTHTINERVLRSEQAVFSKGRPGQTKTEGWQLGLLKPMVNLAVHGQNGLSPDLRYLVANSSYVSRNSFCVLISAPRLFEFLPNSQYYIAALKSFFESWVESWDGIEASLSVEFETTQVGAVTQQFDVSQVKRSTSTPVSEVPEKYGMPIQRLLSVWIEYGFGSPETFIPAVVTLGEKFGNGQVQSDPYNNFYYLPDFLSASALFYEPTPEGTGVQKAVLCAGMMPKSAGDYKLSRKLQEAGQRLVHSIEWTCTQQTGDGVMYLAEKIHRTLRLTGANPSLRKAFIGDDDTTINRYIQSGQMPVDVTSKLGGNGQVGIYNQANEVASNQRYDGAFAAVEPSK